MESSQHWFLQNIDVSGIFCPGKMSEFRDLHEEKVYPRGSLIYHPGDNSDRIFMLVRGRVKIATQGEGEKEIIKAILEKGEVFGELAIVSDGKRGEFAQAMEETEVCIIHKKDIPSLFRERNTLQLFFLKLFGSRLLEMEARLERMVFRDARSRIIDFILELSDRRGDPVGVEIVVRRFLTHQEIANLTATSRQTVTTVLNELRSKNLIKFDRRRLLIRNRQKLLEEVSQIQ